MKLLIYAFALAPVIVYVLLFVLMTVLVLKFVVGPRRKLAIATLSLFLCIAIPTWDEILGRLALHFLCETQSGIKVYKQVDLPSRYWDERGVPISKATQIDAGNYLNIIGECCYVETTTNKYLPLLNMEKWPTQIRTRISGEVLSEFKGEIKGHPSD